MLQQIYERFATIDDVKKCTIPTSAVLDHARQRRSHVWGPILKQAAQAAGALVPACSVSVMVNVDPDLLERVKAAFPPEMEQRPGDTADSLCSRINSNQWSEKSMVLQGGCGPAR